MNTSNSHFIRPLWGGAPILPARFHAEVLIQILRGEEGLNQATINSTLQYFTEDPDLLVLWQEVRTEIQKEWNGELLLSGTNKLPEHLIDTIRSRIANAMESVHIHTPRPSNH